MAGIKGFKMVPMNKTAKVTPTALIHRAVGETVLKKNIYLTV
jgi:hypothetical protein